MDIDHGAHGPGLRAIEPALDGEPVGRVPADALRRDQIGGQAAGGAGEPGEARQGRLAFQRRIVAHEILGLARMVIARGPATSPQRRDGQERTGAEGRPILALAALRVIEPHALAALPAQEGDDDAGPERHEGRFDLVMGIVHEPIGERAVQHPEPDPAMGIAVGQQDHLMARRESSEAVISTSSPKLRISRSSLPSISTSQYCRPAGWRSLRL